MVPTGPYRQLKIAPPLQEAPMPHDATSVPSRGSNTTTPLANGQAGGSRSRGSQTVVACMACRKRKSKCSRERPRCSTCWSKRTECVYETEEGQTRLEHLRNINANLRNKVDDMSVIILFLQSGAYEEAIEVVHRLRAAQNMEDTVRLIRDSQLMLPDERVGAGEGRLLAKEDSMESVNSIASENTHASLTSSATDPSIMQVERTPEMPVACYPPVNIQLPSLASLTSVEELVARHSPSPPRTNRTLPPLSFTI